MSSCESSVVGNAHEICMGLLSDPGPPDRSLTRAAGRRLVTISTEPITKQALNHAASPTAFLQAIQVADFRHARSKAPSQAGSRGRRRELRRALGRHRVGVL